MKQKLLALLLFISGIANAQFTIWEDDFDDAEASDWILTDADGDGMNWVTRNNLQVDENGAISSGSYKVLGTYNIDLASGAPLGVEQKNWAIMPEIDLSYYAGSMEMVVNAQKAIFDGPDNLYIYASTTDTNIESFTQIGTLEITRESVTDAEFKDYIVDISQLVGKQKVYIAFVTTPNFVIGYEIDKISITAARLGLDDVDGKKKTYLKQNPVKDLLKLEIADTADTENLDLKIYNVSGVLVKKTKYNSSGIAVNDLSSGLYFLVIEGEDSIQKIKFIKQ